MPNDCFFWSWPNPSEVLNFDLEKYENHLQEGFKKQLVYPKPRKSYIMHISTMLLIIDRLGFLHRHFSPIDHDWSTFPVETSPSRYSPGVRPPWFSLQDSCESIFGHVACQLQMQAQYCCKLSAHWVQKLWRNPNVTLAFSKVFSSCSNKFPCSHSLPAVLALLHHHHVPQKWNIKSVKYKQVSWILRYLWCAWNSELFFAFAVACLAFGP